MTETIDLSQFSTERQRPWLFADFIPKEEEILFEEATLETSKTGKKFLVWKVTSKKELEKDKLKSKKFRLSHYQLSSDYPYTAEQIVRRSFLVKNFKDKVHIISEIKNI